jgi:hypothetical protein
MISSKASTRCRSKSYGCLATRSAVFIKFLPAKAAQCRSYRKFSGVRGWRAMMGTSLWGRSEPATRRRGQRRHPSLPDSSTLHPCGCPLGSIPHAIFQLFFSACSLDTLREQTLCHSAEAGKRPDRRRERRRARVRAVRHPPHFERRLSHYVRNRAEGRREHRHGREEPGKPCTDMRPFAIAYGEGVWPSSCQSVPSRGAYA